MKTNLLLILSLFLLASCNGDSGDDKQDPEIPATGNISKAWGKYSNLVKTIDSLDLSDPASIKAVKVGKLFKTGVGQNQVPIYKMSYSDCEFSSGGPVMKDEYYGHYDVTLVSGDEEICGSFLPVIKFRHYGFVGEEFLSTGFGLLK